MGAASAFTAATSFAAHTTTPGLPTAVATATSAMPATAMAVAGGERLAPAPGSFEQGQHEGRVEHRRDESHFRQLSDRMRHLQDQHTKQSIRNKLCKIDIAERLQLISTDLLGPVTPMTRGNYRFMAKYADHYTTLKELYFSQWRTRR